VRYAYAPEDPPDPDMPDWPDRDDTPDQDDTPDTDDAAADRAADRHYDHMMRRDG
jgi:hypothetical protein